MSTFSGKTDLSPNFASSAQTCCIHNCSMTMGLFDKVDADVQDAGHHRKIQSSASCNGQNRDGAPDGMDVLANTAESVQRCYVTSENNR